MANNTDAAVLELLKKVDAKRKQIEAAKKKPKWLTTCTLGYNPETTADRVNIMTVRDTQKLVDLYAFLLNREDVQTRAATELEVDAEPTYMGYTFADWKADLKTRMAQLTIERKQKELDALDARVNKLVSPDQRREMELAALQAELAAE